MSGIEVTVPLHEALMQIGALAAEFCQPAGNLAGVLRVDVREQMAAPIRQGDVDERRAMWLNGPVEVELGFDAEFCPDPVPAKRRQ